MSLRETIGEIRRPETARPGRGSSRRRSRTPRSRRGTDVHDIAQTHTRIAAGTRGRRAARAPRTGDRELREVIRLQTLSGKALRDARIPIAVEPAAVFRTLP